MPDYTSITELPGQRVGGFRFDVICRRYAFASRCVKRKRVLEVGCGPGLALGALSQHAQWTVAGDVVTSALKAAVRQYRGRPQVNLLCFNGHHLPFRNHSFDVILAMANIYYMDYGQFLGEVRRVLAPGGLLLADIPNRDAKGFRPSLFSTRYYSPEEMCALLAKHDISVELYGLFPVPTGKAGAMRTLATWGNNLLGLLPFSDSRKDCLKDCLRAALGYQSKLLTGELTEADLREREAIPLYPLPPEKRDTRYLVHYYLCRTNAAPS